MNKFTKLVIVQFLPWFIGMLLLATMAFVLIDILIYIDSFFEKDIPFTEIMAFELLHIPKALSQSLSLSLLFASSFSFGSLSANNELLAVHSAGVSLYRFALPILILGAGLSLGQFFWEDLVVIPTQRAKAERQVELLDAQEDTVATKSILDQGGRIVYFFDFYNPTEQKMFNPLILIRGDQGNLKYRIDANNAFWDQDHWELVSPRIFSWTGKTFLELTETIDLSAFLTEDPQTIYTSTTNIEEMPLMDGWAYVQELKENNLEYLPQESNLYQRFSFALIPLMVVLLGIPLGSFLRRNVMITSLFCLRGGRHRVLLPSS
jgi:lipopolysaccharide export system permease protein